MSVKKVTSNPAEVYDMPELAISTGRNGGKAFMYMSSTICPAVYVARMLRSDSCGFTYCFLRRANRVNILACVASTLNPRDRKSATVAAISLLFTSTEGS